MNDKNNMEDLWAYIETVGVTLARFNERLVELENKERNKKSKVL